MAKSKAKSLDAGAGLAYRAGGRCVYHPVIPGQLHAGLPYRRVSVSEYRLHLSVAWGDFCSR